MRGFFVACASGDAGTVCPEVSLRRGDYGGDNRSPSYLTVEYQVR